MGAIEITFTKTGTDDYRNVTTGQASWTVTAGTTNDLRVVGTMVESSTITVSSISGGGVTTWARAGSVFATGSNRQLDIWYGSVTGSGTSLGVSYSAAIGSTRVRQWKADFRSDLSGARTWQVIATADQTNSSSATVTFPSMTTTLAGQLYFSCGHVANTASAGSTSGFSYAIDANGNPRCWNLNCPAETSMSATCTQSPAGTSYFKGAIIGDTVSATQAPAGTAAPSVGVNDAAIDTLPSAAAPAGLASVSSGADSVTAFIGESGDSGSASVGVSVNNASVSLKASSGLSLVGVSAEEAEIDGSQSAVAGHAAVSVSASIMVRMLSGSGAVAVQANNPSVATGQAGFSPQASISATSNSPVPGIKVIARLKS